MQRAGFDKLRGAVNPRITVGSLSPLEPLRKDIWVDTVSNNVYYWNGSTWIQTLL